MNRLWMLSLVSFVALSAHADTIIFKNGQEIIGKIIEEKPEFLIVKVEFGTLHVDREKVAKIEVGEVAMKQGSGTGGGGERSAGADALKAAGKEDLAKMVAEKIKEKKARDAQAQGNNNKSAAKPAAGTAQNQNGNQSQQWSDNYVNWRRTFRTKDEGDLRPNPNSNARNAQNNPNSSADRMTSRNNSGGSAPRYSGNGSVPNGMKNLPPDLMKQVQQYLPK